MRIFLSGSTGAVGRYVVDELLETPSHHLVLLVRDPSRLPPEISSHRRVTVVRGTMGDAPPWIPTVGPVDAAVLLATSWGEDAFAVNLDATLVVADALAGMGARRLVYFGTASVLQADGSPLPVARSAGTLYIASKAACRAALLERWPIGLTIVHPTLVVAGAPGRPLSHLASLLREIDRHAWLARWVTGEGSFHLVHAADLARIAGSLVTLPDVRLPRELVAGAPGVSLAAALDLLLERNGRRRLGAIDLTPARVQRLVRIFRVQLTEWDRHCLGVRHFTYDGARLSVEPDRPPRYPDTRAILTAIPR